MRVLTINLKDIVLGPGNEIDLEAVPVDDAIRLITEHYSFLSPKVEVVVEDGIATISVPDISPEASKAAEKDFEKALEAAQQGKYPRAIGLFRQALQRVPAHVEARRNLAMALLESGKPDEALNDLIDVLRQEPHDVWANTLVGNIFFQRVMVFQSLTD